MTHWNYEQVKKKLDFIFNKNSETELLELIKNNSFLLYELYFRKFNIQPAFHEVMLGQKFRCDFVWLNDNSDGPEWVLVEIEKPNLKLFKRDGKPTMELNNAIEQVRSWERYFFDNPNEKKRIFGAVAKFRYILVIGNKEDWKASEDIVKWRLYNNLTDKIEIRTSDIFYRALDVLDKKPDDLWSFKDHPITLPHKKLEDFWRNYGYIDYFRKIL